MAKNIKLDGDFDNFDMDGEEFSDLFSDENDGKREPLSVKGVLKATRKVDLTSEVTNPTKLRNNLRKMLPQSLKTEEDKYSTVFSDTADAISKETSDIKKQVSHIATTLNKIAPDEGMLRKLFDKTLGRFIEDKETERERQKSEQEARDAEAKETLDSTLGAVEDIKQSIKENIQNQVLEDRRVKSTNTILTDIYKNTLLGSEYNFQFDQKWKRKTLEIQVKHYLVARDSLNLLKQAAVRQDEQLKAIIKNTGLPDLVKVKQSELAHAELLQSARTYTSRKLFKENDLAKAIRNNLVKKVQTLGGDIKTHLESLTSGLDMVETLQGMAIPGQSKNDIVAEQIAGAGVGMLSTKIGNILAKNPKITKAFLKAKRFGSGPSETLYELAAKMNTDTNIGRFSRNMVSHLGDLVSPEFAKDNVNLKLEDLNSPAQIDVRSKIALNYAIPGYLRKIHGEVRAIRYLGVNNPQARKAKPEQYEVHFDMLSRTFKGSGSVTLTGLQRKFKSAFDKSTSSERESATNLFKSLGATDKQASEMAMAYTMAHRDSKSAGIHLLESDTFKAKLGKASKTKLKSIIAKANQDNDVMDSLYDLSTKIRGAIPSHYQFVEDIMNSSDAGTRALLKAGVIKWDDINKSYSLNSENAADFAYGGYGDLLNTKGDLTKDIGNLGALKEDVDYTGLSNEVTDIVKKKAKQVKTLTKAEYRALAKEAKEVGWTEAFLKRYKDPAQAYAIAKANGAKETILQELAVRKRFLRRLDNKFGVTKKAKEIGSYLKGKGKELHKYVKSGKARKDYKKLEKDIEKNYSKIKTKATKYWDNREKLVKEAKKQAMAKAMVIKQTTGKYFTEGRAKANEILKEHNVDKKAQKAFRESIDTIDALTGGGGTKLVDKTNKVLKRVKDTKKKGEILSFLSNALTSMSGAMDGGKEVLTKVKDTAIEASKGYGSVTKIIEDHYKDCLTKVSSDAKAKEETMANLDQDLTTITNSSADPEEKKAQVNSWMDRVNSVGKFLGFRGLYKLLGRGIWAITKFGAKAAYYTGKFGITTGARGIGAGLGFGLKHLSKKMVQLDSLLWGRASVNRHLWNLFHRDPKDKIGLDEDGKQKRGVLSRIPGIGLKYGSKAALIGGKLGWNLTKGFGKVVTGRYGKKKDDDGGLFSFFGNKKKKGKKKGKKKEKESTGLFSYFANAKAKTKGRKKTKKKAKKDPWSFSFFGGKKTKKKSKKKSEGIFSSFGNKKNKLINGVLNGKKKGRKGVKKKDSLLGKIFTGIYQLLGMAVPALMGIGKFLFGGGLLKAIISPFKFLGGGIGSMLKAGGKGFLSLVSGTGNILKGLFKGGSKATGPLSLVSSGGSFLSSVGSKITATVAKGGGLLSKLGSGIKGAFNGAKNFISSGFEKAKAFVLKVKKLVPDFMKQIGKRLGKKGGPKLIAKILGKLTAKLVPGVGTALLLADLAMATKFMVADKLPFGSAVCKAMLGFDPWNHDEPILNEDGTPVTNDTIELANAEAEGKAPDPKNMENVDPTKADSIALADTDVKPSSSANTTPTDSIRPPSTTELLVKNNQTLNSNHQALIDAMTVSNKNLSNYHSQSLTLQQEQLAESKRTNELLAALLQKMTAGVTEQQAQEVKDTIKEVTYPTPMVDLRRGRTFQDARKLNSILSSS